MGAAPTLSRIRKPVGLIILSLFALVAGHADARTPSVERTWSKLWAVEIARPQQVVKADLPMLRSAGVTALVIERRKWTAVQQRALVTAARGARMIVVEAQPIPKSDASWTSLARSCRTNTGTVRQCALLATSAKQARTLANQGTASYVIVHLASPAGAASLRPNRSRTTRIIAIVPMRNTASYRASLSAAIAEAENDPSTTLAVGPVSTAQTAVSPYTSLVTGITRTAKAVDTSPPTSPPSLRLTASTSTSLTVAWDPAHDDVGVTNYDVLVDGAKSESTDETSATISGLSCGSQYTVAVDAVDAAGNTSTQSSIDSSTVACSGGGTSGTSGVGGGGGTGGGGGGGGGSTPDTTPPTTPAGVSASSSTQTSISLAWAASTDNTAVTGYGVYANSALEGSTTASPYTVTGLTCGTTYTLAVDAVDAAGNRSGKGTVSASTATCPPAPDTQAPTTPGGVNTSSSTQTSIALSWTASTDNTAVSGYGVYANSALKGSTTASPYTVTGLTCGTTYTLAVDAVDAAGNRSGKGTVSASTATCPPAPDTTPPTTPTGVNGSSFTQTSIALSWTASTDNTAVTGYGIYSNSVFSGSASASPYTLSGLTCGTTYTLAVDAVDAAGNRSGKGTVSASTATCPPAPDTQAPTPPASLTSTTVTASSITLGWQAATDNVGVAGYGVYEAGSLNTSTTGTSYTLNGLACGTSYSLAVDAFDAAGNRSSKATISASTATCPPAPDTQAPTTPTGLGVVSKTQTSIAVSWAASTDNVAVTGYGAYQAGVAQGSTTATSYTFSGLACGSSYTLAVDAYDAAGNRSTKAVLSASTIACPDVQAPTTPTSLHASTTTTTSIALAWTAATDNVGVSGYGVYTNGTLASSTASTTYTVSGLTCGTSYSFAVDAYDAAGNRSAQGTLTTSTSACPDTQAPTSPTSLQVTTSTPTSVTFSWSASTDNVGVSGYGVYQGGSLTGSTNSTSYTVASLTCGTNYSFGVDAYDAAGNRSTQTTLSASTSACGAAANLWVDATGGSCGRQATAGAYSDAQACASFAAAFSAAQCGDTVGVQAGSYGAQSVSATKSCTSATPVTFVAQGAVNLTGGLDVNASYATFSGSGFNFANTYTVEQGVSYDSFVGVSAPHAFIMGSHVTIQGGQIGPNNVCNTGWEDGLQIWDNGTASASYVTVDGVTFHDISDNGNECSGFANSGVHVDCIQLLGPNNVTIQNNHFYNCATSDVIGRPYTTPLSNITIQNNMMGPVVTPGASINIGSTGDVCNNVLIQYNTVSGTYPSAICSGTGSSGNIVRGNIFPGYYAQAGFTNSYNVTEQTTPTGTGSKECTPIFNPGSSATADYHLASTDTCAKNAGDPANAPSTDIDGNARPAGSAPDAGADEVG